MPRKSLIIQFVSFVILTSGYLVAIEPSMADTLRLKMEQREVRISKSRVTIGDVCQVVGGKVSVQQRVRDLDLHLFSDDQVAEITANHVRIRLRLAGFRHEEFTVEGDLVRVVPENQGWLESLISTTVRQELARQFGLELNDIQIGITKSPAFEKLASAISHSNPQLTPVFGNRLPLGDVNIQLRYSDRTNRSAATTIPLQVAVFKQVFVTRTPVRKGETILANAVFPVKRPIADGKSSPADANCIGCVAVEDIGPHQVVLTQYLKGEPLGVKAKGVRVNDYVDVIIQRGGISAKLKNAKVVTSGAVGERVQFQNPNSGKRLTAVVQDHQTLIIR